MDASREAGTPALYRPCVGAMLVNPRGLVWVGRRNDLGASAAAPWQMPQGGIGEGEDPRDAALRELREETGAISFAILAESRKWHAYDFPPEILGKAWKGRFRGQRQKWFLVRFDGDDSEFDTGRTRGDDDPEFDAWKWVEIDRLADLIVAFKRPVYEAVVEEFAPLVERIAAGAGTGDGAVTGADR